MNRIVKFWTASIAYVALALGAGASIMFNILDTMQRRGQSFDRWDLLMAILAPAMVVLMVEMFVSRLWSGDLGGQIIRWVATLAIGGVAMRVSWTHGHDFLASHGQTDDVAILWPLAIDSLAIMATALILAGRRRNEVAMATPSLLATPATIPDEDMARLATRFGQIEDHSMFADPVATQPDDPTIDVASELARWEAGYQQAMTELGQEMATEAEEYLAMNTASLPKRQTPVIEKVPDAAREFIVNMIRSGAAPAEIDQATAEMQECSIRTARRYRGIVSKYLSKEDN